MEEAVCRLQEVMEKETGSERERRARGVEQRAALQHWSSAHAHTACIPHVRREREREEEGERKSEVELQAERSAMSRAAYPAASVPGGKGGIAARASAALPRPAAAAAPEYEAGRCDDGG